MKILTLVLLAAVMLAAAERIDRDPDPSAIDADEQVVSQFVRALPEIKRSVDEKHYTGTLAEVLAAKLADTRAVLDEAARMNKKAEGVIAGRAEYAVHDKAIKQVYDRHTDVTAVAETERLASFLAAVVEIVSDPNGLPPPDTGAYIDETLRRLDILAVCIEITTVAETEEETQTAAVKDP